MGVFDPATFLGTEHEESLSTDYILVPEGEYTAQCQEVTPESVRVIETKDGQRTVVDLNWLITNEAVKEATHRDRNSVRQSLFLDLTPEGNLDMSEGMNVALGRVREAVRQNSPGRPWSFRMLGGNTATVFVKHTKSEERMYANVTKVTALVAY
jgi:hypothetical protein